MLLAGIGDEDGGEVGLLRGILRRGGRSHPGFGSRSHDNVCILTVGLQKKAMVVTFTSRKKKQDTLCWRLR